MYLISIYFDNKTNNRIQQLINQVAEKSGNPFMIDGKVPPHITISAFETKQEQEVIHLLEKKVKELKSGTLTWASVGVFLPYVIYLAPVLNKYLYELSREIYECVSEIEDVSISKFYRPLQWLPHATIGKKLSKEEMVEAFQVLQGEFGVFHGQVTSIGLARTNPYENIVCFQL